MRTYTQEEKQAVIDRVISGELSTHILADTGIPKSTFYGWLRAYRGEQEADNQRTVSIRNFHLLENKVARLVSLCDQFLNQSFSKSLGTSCYQSYFFTHVLLLSG